MKLEIKIAENEFECPPTVLLCDEHGNKIAECGRLIKGEVAKKRGSEIARRWNAHDELVAENAELRKALDSVVNLGSGEIETHGDDAYFAVEAARAILAKKVTP